MWANNVLLANNLRSKKASMKWRKKAWLIDLRKTRLVIERENADSENVSSRTEKSQLNPAVPEIQFSVTHDVDSLEEP